jgi:DivIVA domain-containing protein
MELTPQDIEGREFSTVRKGYDPSEVRAFLRQLAASRATTSYSRIGDEMAKLLETAHQNAERIENEARAEADRVEKWKTRLETEIAERQAQVEAECEAREQAAVEQADLILGEAEGRAAATVSQAEEKAASLVADAERDAHERSIQVLTESQRRLDRLLAAERDVHDRLVAAVEDAKVAVGRVGGGQDAELALTTADPMTPAVEVPAWADEPQAASGAAHRAGSDLLDDEAATVGDEPAAAVVDRSAEGDRAEEPEPRPTPTRDTAGTDALGRMVGRTVADALRSNDG